MQVVRSRSGAGGRLFSFLFLCLAGAFAPAASARAAESCPLSVGGNAPTIDQSSARALAPVVKTLLTHRLDEAGIGDAEKAPLLASLDKAVADYVATAGGGSGGAGAGNNSG